MLCCLDENKSEESICKNKNLGRSGFELGTSRSGHRRSYRLSYHGWLRGKRAGELITHTLSDQCCVHLAAVDEPRSETGKEQKWRCLHSVDSSEETYREKSGFLEWLSQMSDSDRLELRRWTLHLVLKRFSRMKMQMDARFEVYLLPIIWLAKQDLY